MPPTKPRKLKVKSSLVISRKELSNIHAGLETAYYDTYGSTAKQAVLRMANLVAEAGGLEPFVPDED